MLVDLGATSNCRIIYTNSLDSGAGFDLRSHLKAAFLLKLSGSKSVSLPLQRGWVVRGTP
jgi:hypothetical protein